MQDLLNGVKHVYATWQRAIKPEQLRTLTMKEDMKEDRTNMASPQNEDPVIFQLTLTLDGIIENQEPRKPGTKPLPPYAR